MYKIIYFDYAAVAVLCILLFSARYLRVGKTNGNRAFTIVIIEFLATAVMDIGSVLLDNVGATDLGWKYFFHSGYLLLHTVSSLFYLVYLISLTDSWSNFKKHKLYSPLMLGASFCYLVLVILNLFGTVDLFHFDEAGVYTRGAVFFSGYIVGALNMLLGIAYIISYRKLFTTKWIITLFAPFPIIGISMLIQFIRPDLIIEMFFNALALLFIFTNIQKPEELKDDVTGLWNEKTFEDHCKKVFFNQKTVSVLLIDIKNINTLEEILDYNSIRDFLRERTKDILDTLHKYNMHADLFSGRPGRFYVFVDEEYRDSIEMLSESLLQCFHGSHEYQNTALNLQSVICVISLPDDISDFDDFIRFASGNSAKLDAGKVYSLSEMFKDRYFKILMNINSIIVDAVRYQRFEMYYQPIYSCRLKRFVSAEALLRLNDPDFGLISPDIFIPAAEQNGAIFQITDFVLDNVCGFIASDSFKKLGVEYIEVNLSAIECAHDDLKERIMAPVKKYGISTRNLALEITETALVYDSDRLKENFVSIAREGIKFCLDDYGTGYSDTRRIIDLPLSVIKLDKSFLDGLDRKLNQVIVRDTIKMIIDIGHHTVAEGVETEETLQLLESFGCDLIQGYYFSRPLSRQRFEEFCLFNNANEITK